MLAEAGENQVFRTRRYHLTCESRNHVHHGLGLYFQQNGRYRCENRKQRQEKGVRRAFRNTETIIFPRREECPSQEPPAAGKKAELDDEPFRRVFGSRRFAKCREALRQILQTPRKSMISK